MAIAPQLTNNRVIRELRDKYLVKVLRPGR